MQTDHNVRLTSAEIGQLWSSYMADTMSNCVLNYLLNSIEDSEVRSVIQYALSLTQKHIERLQTIFRLEKFPIPVGFTDQDINVSAPRLYSDSFYLEYTRNMAKAGLPMCGMALSMSAREDVRDYYSECVASATELYNKSAGVLLSKGLFIRAPYISIPENVDFVRKQNFLNGFLGEQRSLLATEIGQIYANLQTNAIGRALLLGFSQVTTSERLRQYFMRGAEIAKKHIEVLHKILLENDLPTPTTWDTDIMDSTTAPFSDKLMLFHTTFLVNSGFINYAASVSSSMRRDLALHFSRMGTESLQYGEDGLNIMIDHGWLEQAPQVDDRKALTAL